MAPGGPSSASIALFLSESQVFLKTKLFRLKKNVIRKKKSQANVAALRVFHSRVLSTLFNCSLESLCGRKMGKQDVLTWYTCNMYATIVLFGQAVNHLPRNSRYPATPPHCLSTKSGRLLQVHRPSNSHLYQKKKKKTLSHCFCASSRLRECI